LGPPAKKSLPKTSPKVWRKENLRQGGPWVKARKWVRVGSPWEKQPWVKVGEIKASWGVLAAVNQGFLGVPLKMQKTAAPREKTETALGEGGHTLALHRGIEGREKMSVTQRVNRLRSQPTTLNGQKKTDKKWVRKKMARQTTGRTVLVPFGTAEEDGGGTCPENGGKKILELITDLATCSRLKKKWGVGTKGGNGGQGNSRTHN